ncbi:major facilitator superfamily domain-containing protein [Lophiotrema nucula]|uniref:Major facilitator superfamily domain-containing protein n=1 Tax=Lophiotrema nucula TaxID=690887 RepID=A0A6A5ZQ06_9PLEO|nr:major facilitator superfamily domain-containing protein [Lophiotrema nucula]
MAEVNEGPPFTHAQTPNHLVEPSEVERPTGWKYKRLKFGSIALPWYASPESQLILVSFVCFLCPGMFNAVNGMGGGGQFDTHANSASNTALYATFAIVGFFAGSVVNALGIRAALSFGGLGYCVYISSYLCYNYTQNFGYVVFAGFFLGCCAGILWSAQGAIMMSYPPERLKGRYISWFWIIFNLGAVIGSLVELGLNAHNQDNTSVSNGTYIGFLILTFFGAVLSWTLVDAKHVVRRDGSRIILMKHPTWKTEILGLWETLWTDPYVILLFPMFFASNWFYTYQFNDVNHARFNTRTRALNNTLYWVAQMLGALVFGFALDLNIRRTTRAKIAWISMLVLTFAVWGGGYAFQKKYTRSIEDPKLADAFKYDWDTNGYAGPLFLYIFYGFYDAAWQTCVYWFMGAITNNSRKLANFAGFYKGIQSAGAAIIWRLDGYGKPPPYMNLFASCWVLLAGSLVIALPVMILKIKDTVPIEEDLKFTDETMEDVIGHKVTYDYPERQKV